MTSLNRFSLVQSLTMAEGGPGAAKRPKRECSYQTEWKNCGVSASTNFAHCDHCGTEISIGHGGVNDVKKHPLSIKRLSNIAAVTRV